MPSSKTWPGDDRPDYIIRSERSLRTAEDHARGNGPWALTSLHLVADHYTAIVVMKELKQILDNYVDGVQP
jgi:hypothetical protein